MRSRRSHDSSSDVTPWPISSLLSVYCMLSLLGAPPEQVTKPVSGTRRYHLMSNATNQVKPS